jgi:hypothetical protein
MKKETEKEREMEKDRRRRRGQERIGKDVNRNGGKSWEEMRIERERERERGSHMLRRPKTSEIEGIKGLETVSTEYEYE